MGTRRCCGCHGLGTITFQTPGHRLKASLVHSGCLDFPLWWAHLSKRGLFKLRRLAHGGLLSPWSTGAYAIPESSLNDLLPLCALCGLKAATWYEVARALLSRVHSAGGAQNRSRLHSWQLFDPSNPYFKGYLVLLVVGDTASLSDLGQPSTELFSDVDRWSDHWRSSNRLHSSPRRHVEYSLHICP